MIGQKTAMERLMEDDDHSAKEAAAERAKRIYDLAREVEAVCADERGQRAARLIVLLALDMMLDKRAP